METVGKTPPRVKSYLSITSIQIYKIHLQQINCHLKSLAGGPNYRQSLMSATALPQIRISCSTSQSWDVNRFLGTSVDGDQPPPPAPHVAMLQGTKRLAATGNNSCMGEDETNSGVLLRRMAKKHCLRLLVAGMEGGSPRENQMRWDTQFFNTMQLSTTA